MSYFYNCQLVLTIWWVFLILNFEYILNADPDDMRAIATKCMWALSTINTPEGIQKLQLLGNDDDLIIKENAAFQLEALLKKNELSK